MDVFNLAAKITLDKSEYERGLDEAENRAKGKGSKIGQALGTIGKVGAAGFVAAGAAVGKLTMDAVNAYAQYEQLEGGVETLFGAGGKSLEEYAESVGKSVDDASGEYNKLMQAQEYVLNRANGAWDSAGLSANQYMETVTGFSASLVQSLGGDTLEAARVSDRAITDMSDNANKMGTSMGSIMNAYMGFSKQNYTMLDNLKLGYGGTKEEMERLIQDAAKMTDVQEELGLTVDSSSMSFGNIVNAISVMQKKMGIAGTTAKEGATTIEGSTNRMKAAWTNVVASFVKGGTPLQESIWDLLNSVEDWMKNIVPAVGNALSGIGEFLEVAVPELLSKIPGMVTALLPGLINAVTKMFASITKLVPAAIKGIMDMIKNLITPSGDEGVSIFGKIFDSLKNLATTTLTSLKQMFVDSFQMIATLVTGIDWMGVGQTILDYISTGIEGAVSFFSDAFENARNAITSVDWGAVGSTILNFITNAISGIVGWVTTTFESAKTAIGNVDWGQAATDVYNKITEIIGGVIDWASTTFESVKGAIGDVNWTEVAQTVYDTIIGIWGAIVEWAKSTFESATESIKEVDWAGVGQFIIDSIEKIVLGIVGWFKAEFEAVKRAVLEVDWLGLGRSILGFIAAAFNGIAEAFRVIFEDVKAKIAAVDWAKLGADMWTAIQKAFVAVGSWLKAKFNTAWDWISKIDWANLGSTIWDKIKKAFNAIGSDLKGKFEFAWKRISQIDFLQWGKNIWDKIKSAFNSIGADLKAKFEEAKATITDPEFWKGIGQSIVDFILEPFKMIGESVAGFIKNIHIPLPKFSKTGETKIGPLSIPTFGVTWEKKAYDLARMFTEPTVLGTPNGMYGFGDGVGGEIVMSDRKLRQIAGGDATAAAIVELTAVVEDLGDSLTEKMAMALNQMGFNIDGREFARLVRTVRTA